MLDKNCLTVADETWIENNILMDRIRFRAFMVFKLMISSKFV